MPANLREVVDQQAAGYADLRQAQYVAPRGLGLHLVLLLPNRDPVIVGAASGSTTWARGAIVLVGAPQGDRQRVIIGNPAPGLGGGAAFAESATEGDLDVPQILLVTPTDLPIGAESNLYVVGLLLRTAIPLDRWDLVYRPFPDSEYQLDANGVILSVAAVPDPEAVGLSLEGEQVALVLGILVQSFAPLGHSFTLRVRR